MMECKYCNKECKNANSQRNHERLCKKNPDRDVSTFVHLNRGDSKYIESCRYCSKEISRNNMKRHESSCDKNPANLKQCPNCGKDFVGESATCSYSCSNSYFRSGKNNPNWKESNYRTTCFESHEKRCVVCGEDKIVAVHHFDHDHDNNDVENLIPLCPTHHQYCHSRYADEVTPIIEEYLTARSSV